MAETRQMKIGNGVLHYYTVALVGGTTSITWWGLHAWKCVCPVLTLMLCCFLLGVCGQLSGDQYLFPMASTYDPVIPTHA